MSDSIRIPERLLESFFSDGVVAFIGAGVSMNEGLPSWRGLMEELLAEFQGNEISDAEYRFVQQHILDEDNLLVADFLKSKLSETRYKNFIEKNFSMKRIGKIHKLLTSIPFCGLLTTNYDDILSHSDFNREFNHPFTWEDPDVLRKIKSKFILHVHGIVSTPGSTILSSSDYEKLSHSGANGLFWEAIKNIFQFHRIIFIGYSLNDPDFNLLIAKLKYLLRGNLNEHHVLIVDESDPLNKHRLEKILGISPIYIHSSGSIGESVSDWLRALKKEIDDRTAKKMLLLDQNIKSFSRIDLLKDSLISFLVKNCSSEQFMLDVANSFNRAMFYTNKYGAAEFWNGVIFQISPAELQKLMVYLLEHNVNDPLIKRLLAHLPESEY